MELRGDEGDIIEHPRYTVTPNLIFGPRCIRHKFWYMGKGEYFAWWECRICFTTVSHEWTSLYASMLMGDIDAHM